MKTAYLQRQHIFGITFELVVRFYCFNFCLKALDVYFTKKPCFLFLGRLLFARVGGKTDQ